MNISQLDLHRADHRLAFGVEHWFKRQILRLEQGVIFRLPIVRVKLLLEVAFAIKQADANEADVEVAGRFGVVARQNAQAAGGDGQGFVELNSAEK